MVCLLFKIEKFYMKKSFIEVPQNHPFPLYNLPYGVFKYQGRTAIGVAIGDLILDLTALEEKGLMPIASLNGKKVFNQQFLNCFISCNMQSNCNIIKPLFVRKSKVSIYIFLCSLSG